MSTSSYKTDALEAKKKLEQVSPTMCLAKWNQTSLHLPTGLTNSCYHPPLHEIDADGDAKLTVDEISAYVRSHGGEPEHLAATVKCRAAAFGTWMLRYDGDPKPIPRPAGYVHGDIVPEFLFPECNQQA